MESHAGRAVNLERPVNVPSWLHMAGPFSLLFVWSLDRDYAQEGHDLQRSGTVQFRAP